MIKSKPLQARKVAGRVRGHLLRFGEFEANFETRELRKRGSKLRLQEQPCRILELLIQRGGEVLTREELRRTLWPDGTYVDFDHGLHTAMSRLREALGDSAAKPRFIETIPRRGYRFHCRHRVRGNRSPRVPLRWRQDSRGQCTRALGRAAGGTTTGCLGSVSRPASAGGTSGDPVSPGSCPAAPPGTAITIVLAAGVGYWASHRAPPIYAIAVLPFANVTADPELDFLSDGLTESLINNLSRVPKLRVLARSTVARYKDGKTDPAIAARVLQVVRVVGDLLRRNNRLVVRVHLIRGSDGSQIWSEHFDRTASEWLAIHDEVASHIANSLGSKLTPDERGKPSHGTSNNRAFELYMRGLHHLNKRNVPAMRMALGYFCPRPPRPTPGTPWHFQPWGRVTRYCLCTRRFRPNGLCPRPRGQL